MPIYHSILQYITVYYSILQYITVYHSILQYTTVYHSIVQYSTRGERGRGGGGKGRMRSGGSKLTEFFLLQTQTFQHFKPFVNLGKNI